jgi:hypothetical protein
LCLSGEWSKRVEDGEWSGVETVEWQWSGVTWGDVDGNGGDRTGVEWSGSGSGVE